MSITGDKSIAYRLNIVKESEKKYASENGIVKEILIMRVCPLRSRFFAGKAAAVRNRIHPSVHTRVFLVRVRNGV
jgi:hypothetical protein